MRLCGISSRFQLLSPCTGQVTHALLTRPPLSPYHLPPEGFRRYVFVRLACVRHAASVHPEPGSNSQIKCLRCQIKVQNHWFFSCHYCLFRFWTFVLFHGLSCRHHSQENPNEIWINVQGCFVIQLSRFLAFSYESFYILSHHFILVKNFFKKLFSSSFEDFCFLRCELLYIITWFLICQEVFSFSFKILVIFLLKMSFSCATHIILS